MVIEYYFNGDDFDFFKVNEDFKINEINTDYSYETYVENDDAYIWTYQFEFENEGLIVIKLKDHVNVVKYISNVFDYALDKIIKIIDNEEVKQQLIAINVEKLI